MTRRERKKCKRAITVIILIAVAAVISAQIGLSVGYDRGFDACIEENNLYERYK